MFQGDLFPSVSAEGCYAKIQDSSDRGGNVLFGALMEKFQLQKCCWTQFWW